MIPRIKLGNKLEYLPIFALGTWDIRDSVKMIKTIRYAIDSGINHIDTAEMYTGAEETISKAVKGIEREKIFITSKVLPSNASYRDTIRSAENSLRRLNTPYIDLYLLHWYSEVYPLEETLSAFSKLIDEGKVRYAGVSNFSIMEMESTIDIFSPKELVNNQVEYNLNNFRYVEENLFSFCERNKITLSGYSPLWQKRPPLMWSKKWRILKKISKKYNKTPYQIVLNFLTRTGKILIIFKTESIEHLKENFNSLNFKLKKEDIEQIIQVFS